MRVEASRLRTKLVLCRRDYVLYYRLPALFQRNKLACSGSFLQQTCISAFSSCGATHPARLSNAAARPPVQRRSLPQQIHAAACTAALRANQRFLQNAGAAFPATTCQQGNTARREERAGRQLACLPRWLYFNACLHGCYLRMPRWPPQNCVPNVRCHGLAVSLCNTVLRSALCSALHNNGRCSQYHHSSKLLGAIVRC